MTKKTLKILVIAVVFLSPISLHAEDVVINSQTNQSYILDSNQQLISVNGTAGNILHSTANEYAISSAQDLLGLSVNINTQSTTKGINDSSLGAINISNSQLKELKVTSGIVTSSGLNTIFLNNIKNGDLLEVNKISLSGSSSVISNTNSSGKVINYIGSSQEGIETNASKLLIELAAGSTLKSADSINARVIYVDNAQADVEVNSSGSIFSKNETTTDFKNYLIPINNTAIQINKAKSFKVNLANNSGKFYGNIVNNSNALLEVKSKFQSIKSNIFLGKNSNSFVEIDDSELIGSINFSDENQNFTLKGSSIFTGKIKGAGNINLGATTNGYSLLRLYGSINDSFDAKINGSVLNNLTFIQVENDQTIIVNEDIGSDAPIGQILLTERSFLDLASNNKTVSLTNNIQLSNSATISLGDRTNNLDIVKSNTKNGQNSSVIIGGDYSLGGDISIGLGKINVNQNKSLTIGNHNISASEIIVNENSSVNFGNGSIVNSNVVASLDGVGEVNFNNDYSLTGNIGSSQNRLLSATLNNNSILNLGDNEVHVIDFRIDEDAVINIDANSKIYGNIVGIEDNFGTVNISGDLTSKGGFGGLDSSLKNVNIAQNTSLNLGVNSINASNIDVKNNAQVTSSGISTINLSDSGFDKVITISDEANLSNSNALGSVINYSGSSQENITVNINGDGNNNQTKIEGSNGSKAITINNENADFTLNNNSGSIIGNILIENANSVTIDNTSLFSSSGIIQGDIKIVGDILTKINLSGDGASITGDIDLGNNASSLIKTDGGSIIGDVKFGDENQILDLHGNTILLGTITGVGEVKLNSINSKIWINEDSTLSANINSADSSYGQIRIMNDKHVILASDIGLEGKIKEIYIQSGATLDTASATGSINADNLYMDSNSTLDLGSSVVDALISKKTGTTGADVTINIKENANLVNDIDIGVGEVVVSQGKSLDLNDNQITAKNIILNEDSTLNVEEGTIVSDIISSGVGFGTVNFLQNGQFLGNIGSLENPLANIIVADGKTVILGKNSLVNSNLIIIGDGASLDVKLEQIVGKIIFQGNSSLTVSDETIDHEIEGSQDAVVNIKTADNQETTTTVNIGSQIALDSFEVGKNAILNLDTNNNSVSSDVIKLNSGSIINVGSGALNGDIIALNSNSGTINFNENNSLNGNVGSVASIIKEVNIAENKTLDLQNFDLNSTNTNLANGSVLNIGSGSINSVINAVSNNVGIINLTENNSIFKNIGSSTKALSEINFAADKVFQISNSSLYSNALNIAANAVVNANGSSNLSGDISLAQDAILNINDSATITGAINGSNQGHGVVNIASSDVYDINYEVGNINKLQEFNIAANSTANAYLAINASNVNVYGSLNLSNQSGNSFSDNLTVKSNSLLHLFDQTHSVGGNLIVESNAVISLDIASKDKAGSLEVAGLAFIAQNAKLNLNISQDVINSLGTSTLSYKIIDSSDASNVNKIADNDIKVLNSTAINFKLSTVIIDNSLFVNIAKQAEIKTDNIAKPMTAIGTTNGQRNLYKELTTNTNSQSPAIIQLKQLIQNAQNTAEVNEVLEDANPQIDNSINRISFENTVDSLLLNSQRISALRGLSSGDKSANSSVWAQSFGTKIKQGKSASSQGYNARTQGFAFGYDKEVSQDLILGFGFSYADSVINSQLKDKSHDVDNYQLNLYAGKDFDGYFTNAMIGFSYNKYYSRRDIAFNNLRASANYSGQSYIGKFEVGSNYNLHKDINLTPIFSLTMAKNHVNNYQENGAGIFNLSVKNNSTSLFETRFGLNISKKYQVNRLQKTQPKLGISYGYDFAGSRQKTRSTFVGQNIGFDASSANLPQGSLKFEAGIKMYHLDALSIDVNYGFDIRNNYQAHSGSILAKYEF